jgi:hypothetical protein
MPWSLVLLGIARNNYEYSDGNKWDNFNKYYTNSLNKNTNPIKNNINYELIN